MEFRAVSEPLIELLKSIAIASRVFSDAHLAFAFCRAGALDSCMKVYKEIYHLFFYFG
jgi:hypothetical protein